MVHVFLNLFIYLLVKILPYNFWNRCKFRGPFLWYSLILILPVHSTDSGGSRRSSQESCRGLSDSGSAEEVEECELQGRKVETERCVLFERDVKKNLKPYLSHFDLCHCMSSKCFYDHISYTNHHAGFVLITRSVIYFFWMSYLLLIKPNFLSWKWAYRRLK